MTEQEIGARLQELKQGLRIFDLIVNYDFKTDKMELTKKQAEFVRQLFDLFRQLDWQIAFNSYKELRCAKDDPPIKRVRGVPVKVRSCKKEHNQNKTYFGILIGDIPLQISHSIDAGGVVTASKAMYNPLIFIPELNDVVFGCESWWGEITSEEELNELITDDVIQNVWYVKMLGAINGK